jgi:hypothetical protein
MMLVTKHFGFYAGRDWNGIHWCDRTIGIGLVERQNRRPEESRFRYGIELFFSLIPDFIWQEIFLGVERGEPVYQYRIIGVHRWRAKFCWYAA